MRSLDAGCLKTVRWTSWPLLALLLAFFATGYAMTGQFGLGGLMEPTVANAWHRLLHWPLLVLTLAHSLPAIYLALQRWGWIRK
jgi:hypothetical protein